MKLKMLILKDSAEEANNIKNIKVKIYNSESDDD